VGWRKKIEFQGFIIAALIVLCATAQADVFSWDDGSVDTFGGTSAGDLLVLNHFVTGPNPVIISAIRVLWNPLSTTVHPAVALYKDPNGDGNPSDMVPLLIHFVPLQPGVVYLNNGTLQGVAIPETMVEGSFFVGAYLSDQEISFDPSIGVDQSYLGPNQSWIIENSSAGALSLQDPIGTSTLRTPLETFIAGNHMVEAVYTPVPEPCTAILLAVGLLSLVTTRPRPRDHSTPR
jgi:hypothetical protein